MLRSRRLVALTRVACVALVVLGIDGCKRPQTVSQSVATIDGTYFEVYSVAMDASDLHSRDVRCAIGQWYRAAEPLVDLTDCKRDDVTAEWSENVGWNMTVRLQEAPGDRFVKWCQDHPDSHLGVVIDGQLIMSARVGTGPAPVVIVRGFASEAGARSVADRIRAGGAVPKAGHD